MMGDRDRQLANLIRIGTIAELDQANALVKVKIGSLSTDWLPWITARAGATRTWSAPRQGEQVVILSPGGDTAQGVVLPSIFQDNHPAPAASQDQETTVYPDGTTVDYNSATNTLTVTVAGSGNVVVNCKQATINAATSVRLDAPLVECTHDLTVGGNVAIAGSTTLKAVTSNGKDISSTHRHANSGGSGTGGAPI